MAFPKQWAAGLAATAVLLGGVACGSSSEKSESKPPVTTTPTSVVGAQTAGPHGASSEAQVAMAQQLMAQLNQLTTGPGGQPTVPAPEEVTALLQSHMDQFVKQAQNKP
jgi:hypothetical protein